MNNKEKTRQSNTQHVSRYEFFKLKFPTLPYCEFGLTRGPSNQFHESFHYRNASSGVQLNVFWDDDETVSIGVYDPRISDKFERNKNILSRSENFNNEILDNYCRKFLC